MDDTITTRCGQHTEEIREIKHALFGNGRPGLKERVTIIETKMEAHSKMLWAIIVLSVPPIIEFALQVMHKQ